MIELGEVRRLLAGWAAWLRAGGGIALGYPKRSAFWALMPPRRDGHKAIAEGQFDELEAQQVERALCALKLGEPAAFWALWQEYVIQATNTDAARACRCSERTYKTRRLQGEMYVAGWIGRERSAKNRLTGYPVFDQDMATSPEV